MSADVRLVSIDAFTFEGIMKAIEPEIKDTLDAIAEIYARTKLSLADEYTAHRPPQGEIVGQSRLRQGPYLPRAPAGETLSAVPEASSGSEASTDDGELHVVGRRQAKASSLTLDASTPTSQVGFAHESGSRPGSKRHIRQQGSCYRALDWRPGEEFRVLEQLNESLVTMSRVPANPLFSVSGILYHRQASRLAAHKSRNTDYQKLASNPMADSTRGVTYLALQDTARHKARDNRESANIRPTTLQSWLPKWLQISRPAATGSAESALKGILGGGQDSSRGQQNGES